MDYLKSNSRKYSALNTARSALSAILPLYEGYSFGAHPHVKLYMKGVYNELPPMPRYVNIWDPEVVLKLLKSWAPASKLSLQKLTSKVAMLLLLVTGQRPQILRALDTRNMQIGTTSIKFVVPNELLKQGRPGFKLDMIVLKKYPVDRRICIYHYMVSYLKRTLDIRGVEKSLFLTTKKPFKKASLNTMSRWLKNVLSLAGIDTSLFTAGSIRSASTSKARDKGVPIDDLMKAGGWTQASTFVKYYSKEIVRSGDFAAKVLDSKGS